MSKQGEKKIDRKFNALASTWHEIGLPEHDPTIAQKQYANSEKMEPLRKRRDEIESECPNIEFDAKHPRHNEYHKILADIHALEEENMKLGHPEPDPGRAAVYDKHYRLEEIADEEAALKAKLDRLRFGDPDVAEIDRIEARMKRLAKEKAALMGQSPGEDLDVFKDKHLTASEVTVRLLRKDENSQPNMVEISARGKTRTALCTDLHLIGKRPKGLLNRAGKMLFALARGTTPKDVKAPEKAMQELRDIFRGIGIMDKDPFHPKKAGWQPRFKLIDAIKQADSRAAKRATHVPYADDRLCYDQEDDEAGHFLAEHDKKLPS